MGPSIGDWRLTIAKLPEAKEANRKISNRQLAFKNVPGGSATAGDQSTAGAASDPGKLGAGSVLALLAGILQRPLFPPDLPPRFIP